MHNHHGTLGFCGQQTQKRLLSAVPSSWGAGNRHSVLVSLRGFQRAQQFLHFLGWITSAHPGHCTKTLPDQSSHHHQKVLFHQQVSGTFSLELKVSCSPLMSVFPWKPEVPGILCKSLLFCLNFLIFTRTCLIVSCAFNLLNLAETFASHRFWLRIQEKKNPSFCWFLFLSQPVATVSTFTISKAHFSWWLIPLPYYREQHSFCIAGLQDWFTAHTLL